MRSFQDLEFDNIYGRLPEIFYSRHQPSALSNQYLIHFNDQVAALLGIDGSEQGRRELTELVTRNEPFDSFDPLAMCYAGHQFGQFVPRLGDGRAILLGQLIGKDSQRWDLQLKGAGRTLYSRQGDGKAVLRSTIREHLCSAAMHGLGIPTTLSLAMFGSDEQVLRERAETGAMLIRVAPSHIRFGSFEYFFYTQRYDDLKTLADFTVDHYFPALGDGPDRYIELLRTVVRSTASLIARWQSVGFCHGVMNSDNMSIHGITIDYGPFGFLDAYDPGHICNHSDYGGRYAFNQQPRIGLFNLSCLAQSLLPLFDEDPQTAADLGTDALREYEGLFAEADLACRRAKLGLQHTHDGDSELFDDLLGMMHASNTDFTILFRTLAGQGVDSCRDLFVDRDRFDRWAARYAERVEKEQGSEDQRRQIMLRANPKYVLRNYLAEEAIRAAETGQDFTPLETLIDVLASPYDEQPRHNRYADLPPDWARTLSVSCSS